MAKFVQVTIVLRLLTIDNVPLPIATPRDSSPFTRYKHQLCRTLLPKMSFLNVSGGRSASALFSIQSPQNTIRPPIEANINSTKNHGDETSFTTKCIYLF